MQIFIYSLFCAHFIVHEILMLYKPEEGSKFSEEDAEANMET